MIKKEEQIKNCPKCNSPNLDIRGGGEYYYGSYEFHEWYCKDCGYSEQEYYCDKMDEEMEAKQNLKDLREMID